MDIKLVAAVAYEELNVRRWCRMQGISPSTFYKWRARFLEGGVEALSELSRRPRRSPSTIVSSIEEAIVVARKDLIDQGWDGGADSILARLILERVDPLPSRATIWRVLRRRGMITAQPSKRPKASWRRFEWTRPNDCWQIDATHWTLANDTVVEIINIIDDHSRVLICSLAVPVTSAAAAWAAFLRGARQWGLPGHVLSDNGLAFTATRHKRAVPFATNLRALGITPISSTPFHPQTCGKVERFHWTLKQWLAKHPAATSIAELQQLLDDFAGEYNHHRPHQSCNDKPPITKWQASATAGPAQRPVGMPTSISTARVQRPGRVDAAGYAIALGTAWAGKTVTTIAQGHQAIVFHEHTIVRQLTLDPTRFYQRLYTTIGRPPDSVRDVSRHNRPR